MLIICIYLYLYPRFSIICISAMLPTEAIKSWYINN